MDSLDLNALDTRAGANAGFWLTLKDPVKGRPLPARLKLLGADSDRFREKLFELQRRRQQELADDAASRLTPEQQEERSLELIACATLGWEGLKKDGAEFAFAGEPSAVALYRGWRWIFGQAQDAVYNRANFLPGSVGG